LLQLIKLLEEVFPLLSSEILRLDFSHLRMVRVLEFPRWCRRCPNKRQHEDQNTRSSQCRQKRRKRNRDDLRDPSFIAG
jgi:hypothetical protein